jgi:hypothetical protein
MTHTNDEAKAATPHHDLIAELLNPNIPKTEREHAASREIERLQALAAPTVQEPVGWNKRIIDSVDFLLAQAGFEPDSSVRHQLAMMNFDVNPASVLPEKWRNVLPGGRGTDQWESARVADFNKGWNEYRKAAKAALEKLEATPPAAPSQYGSPELQAMIVARAIEKDRAAQPVAILNHAHGVYAFRSVNLQGLPDGEYQLCIAPSEAHRATPTVQEPDAAALFREALAFGLAYGPEIPAHQWDEMREEKVTQLVARLTTPPAQPPAWQPIETAPMNGEKFWGYRRGKQGVAFRIPRDDCEMWEFCGWSADSFAYPEVKPTHWMPLPVMPKTL